MLGRLFLFLGQALLHRHESSCSVLSRLLRYYYYLYRGSVPTVARQKFESSGIYR